MIQRQVVVVIPARDEADRIEPCLRRCAGLLVDERVDALAILVLANNCRDATAARARDVAADAEVRIVVEIAGLPPERANAGWARRLAFDAGARLLKRPQDLLLCTDADTLVADDWLLRTLDHFDAGFDAVAGFARFDPRELRTLDPDYRKRLAAIRRYEDAFDYLRCLSVSDEPSPRHFYEGGASMAISLDAYEAIGGAPTPPVGEDKALFEALRAKGRRIRHAKDVRVLTSCRLDGRAPDGAADTLARWSVQGDRDGLWGIMPLATLGGSDAASDQPMTLERLPAETQTARAMVQAVRSRRTLAKAS